MPRKPAHPNIQRFGKLEVVGTIKGSDKDIIVRDKNQEIRIRIDYDDVDHDYVSAFTTALLRVWNKQ